MKKNAAYLKNLTNNSNKKSHLLLYLRLELELLRNNFYHCYLNIFYMVQLNGSKNN